MASILCSSCKCGIHYHGIPNGTEYIWIRDEDWKRITSAVFDPTNKVYADDGWQPELYRTDTIEEDFPNAIKRFWKCPECGTLLFFGNKGKMLAAYKPVITDENQEKCSVSGVCFSDHHWDDITEAGIPDNRIPDNVHEVNRIEVSDDTVLIRNVDGSEIRMYRRI